MNKVNLTPKDEALAPLTPDDFKVWRKKHKWTQEVAAKWLCVSLKTYQKWEQGWRKARHPGPVRKRMAQVRIRKQDTLTTRM